MVHDDTDIARFFSKMEDCAESLCWNWQAGKNQNGYGMFKLHGGTMMAHRAGYIMLEGDIPEGMDLDHLCRNRACVNPDHLEPVTHLENVRRGLGSVSGTKDACVNGHVFDKSNSRFTKEGWRYCLDCKRVQWARSNELRSNARKLVLA